MCEKMLFAAFYKSSYVELFSWNDFSRVNLIIKYFSI